MLGRTKSDIYDYAYRCNIPFLPTSTPSWCHRGQIRSQIVPVVNLWDPGFISGLYDVSEHMRDMSNIMNSYIDNIVAEGCYLSKIETSVIFWRIFLNRLGVSPSDKCLKELCERLKVWKENEVFKIPLTKSKTMCISTSPYLVEIK